MTPLEIAATQVGITEATGANDGEPSTRYMGGKRQPWCAEFVCWCFAQAGRPLPGYRPSRAPDANGFGEAWNPLAAVHTTADETGLHNTCVRLGWMLAPGQEPRPGDLIFLSERGKSDPGSKDAHWHVGMVVMVADAYVLSIDGNWGNSVQRVSRPRAEPAIVGYARPWGGT